jgi:hypothetical protein
MELMVAGATGIQGKGDTGLAGSDSKMELMVN